MVRSSVLNSFARALEARRFSAGEILFQSGESAHQYNARQSKQTTDQTKHGDADDQQSLPPKGGRHTELGDVEGRSERPQELLYREWGGDGFGGVLVVHAPGLGATP